MNRLELKIPPLLCVVIVAALMLLTDQVTPAFEISWLWRAGLAGASLFVSAVVMYFCFTAFHTAKTTLSPTQPNRASKLIRHGVFAYSRNPIYLAMLLWLLALAFWLANVVVLLGCVLFCWYITTFQIKPEERALTQRFGDEYRQYVQQVRRWL